MVQTFPPDGTDQPLDIRISPLRSRRGNHFPHPQAFRQRYPVTTVDRIAVAQKISAPVVPGQSLRICCMVHSCWDVPSLESAVRGAAHATTPRTQTEVGRSPSAPGKNRRRTSVPCDWSRRFAKFGTVASAGGEDI